MTENVKAEVAQNKQSAAQAEDSGANPLSAPSKVGTWRQLGGIYPQLRREEVSPDGRYLSIYYWIRCPLCLASHRPNVTRTAHPEDWQAARLLHATPAHCNRCRVRFWVKTSPFRSSHGDPISVRERDCLGAR